MAKDNSIPATGRRKNASARVRISPVAADAGKSSEGRAPEGQANIVVNGKALEDYFPTETHRMIINQPLLAAEAQDKYSFVVRVRGGGVTGQAGAVRHGIARALEKMDEELRPILKSSGFLTRDPRAVERKKPGRHKARKKPQFSKR